MLTAAAGREISKEEGNKTAYTFFYCVGHDSFLYVECRSGGFLFTSMAEADKSLISSPIVPQH